MIINDWIERLGSIADTEVRGAADLAAAQDSHHRDAIYVMVGAAEAADNLLSAGVQQQVRTEMLIVLAARNRRDRRGQHLLTELESLREQVRAALLGWIPPAAAGPVTYRRGQLARLGEQTLWWQETYQFHHWIENGTDIV